MSMSSRELQHLVFHQGHFIFFDGKHDEGMIISRYNIPEAQIEYYFIPSENILFYQAARSSTDIDAHKKLGRLIDISNIKGANLIN